LRKSKERKPLEFDRDLFVGKNGGHVDHAATVAQVDRRLAVDGDAYRLECMMAFTRDTKLRTIIRALVSGRGLAIGRKIANANKTMVSVHNKTVVRKRAAELLKESKWATLDGIAIQIRREIDKDELGILGDAPETGTIRKWIRNLKIV